MEQLDILYDVNILDLLQETDHSREKENFTIRNSWLSAERAYRSKKIYGADEDIFNIEHLYNASKFCVLNVGWKTSVQNYDNNMLLECAKTSKAIHDGKYKLTKMPKFTIIDRGKERQVQSIHIKDRAVQRSICDNILWPMIQPRLIYDNYACQPGKGIGLAVKRLTKHLADYYKKYGNIGYVLQIDFKSYFENIDQKKLFSLLKEHVSPAVLDMIVYIITDLKDHGLDIGSQINQILALYYTSEIDHYVKEVLHIKYYARYMDDIYLIHPDKAYLKQCRNEIAAMCAELNITLNAKKTHISKLSKGFTFLKRRFWLDRSGKVLKQVSNKSITRNRRKLIKMYQAGVPKEAALQVLYSVLGYLKPYNNYKARANYIKLFKSLYGDIPQVKGRKKSRAKQ